MGKKVLNPVPAKVVRDWFRSNPESVPEGAEKVIGAKTRGVISPKCVEVFNKANASEGLAYTPGNTATVEVPFTKTDSRGRVLKRSVRMPIERARSLAGETAGARGRLSGKALTAAGEAYVASL